jgi:hypothetical protein
MKLTTIINEFIPASANHEPDDEVGMIKADLYHIYTYAHELHQMLSKMDSYDFPHWWQSKIVEAKHNISSAKHYLEHELTVSDTVLEVKSTCCNNCGRMHPKGTSCPKPYLTGESHCKNRGKGK